MSGSPGMSEKLLLIMFRLLTATITSHFLTTLLTARLAALAMPSYLGWRLPLFFFSLSLRPREHDSRLRRTKMLKIVLAAMTIVLPAASALLSCASGLRFGCSFCILVIIKRVVQP
jgi:hypothetical protein